MTDGPSAVALRFEILGPVRAYRGAEPVDLGPAKQRAVLAVLLLHPGRPVPAHRIVDAVWGAEPPENGVNVVQKYVGALRRALDPEHSPRSPSEVLTLTDGGYLLRVADGALDADAFRSGLGRARTERKAGNLSAAGEAVRQALDLWRAEPLAGLTGPVFDTARARLADERATAWELWAAVELARGNHTGLVPELSRLVQEYPLHEGLRADLMIALHRGGRQAEALAVFRDAREHFLEELGAEPGERMQDAHRWILRGEAFYTEPVDPWAGNELAPPEPTPTLTPTPSPTPTATPPPFSVQPYAAPSPTAPIPQQRGVTTWPPLGPPELLRPAAARRIPWHQVVIAAATPFLTCGFGLFAYFLYAGVQRRDWRQYVFAGVYQATWLVSFLVFGINAPPGDEVPTGPIADGSISIMMLSILVGAVHGAVLASHPGDNRHARRLRDVARMYAANDPAGARQAGIGRPDLIRAFDDGGLVDLNHVPAPELARLDGLTSADAHRIAVDRYERGPYRQPYDLVLRGVLPVKTLRRLESRLICLPPGPPQPYTPSMV